MIGGKHKLFVIGLITLMFGIGNATVTYATTNVAYGTVKDTSGTARYR